MKFQNSTTLIESIFAFNFKTAFVSLLLFVMCSNIAYSNIPAYSETMRIDSITFVCDSVVFVGDTVNLQIKFTSYVRDSIQIALFHLPGIIIIDEDSSNFVKYEKCFADTNEQLTMNYQIVIGEEKYNRLDFLIKTDTENPDAKVLSSFTQELKPNSLGGVVLPYPLDPMGCYLSYLSDQNDDECLSYNFNPINCGVPNEELTNFVNISGKVRFRDTHEPKIMLSEPSKHSPYTEVWLFFKPTFITNQLTHPIDFASTGPIEHIHYAKCNENGEFQFNFEYSIEKLNCELQTDYEILLFVAKENEVIWLESQTNHKKVYGTYNTYRSPTPAHVRFFRDAPITGSVINDNNDYYNSTQNGSSNLEFLIGDDDGSIFRHTYLSRELLKYIYSPQVFSSLDLPQVQVVSRNNYSTSSASSTYLQMKWNDHLTSLVLSHEYGHFLHINNYNMGGASEETEGFATFYSWVYRIWLNNVYADKIDELIDNCELGPFTSVQNYYDGIPEQNEYSNRFGNINKLFDTYVNGRITCAFACFLWNIYDGKFMGNFGFLPYDSKENDDVDGYNFELFNYFLTNQSTYYQTIKDNIKTFFNNSQLNESIDKIYNFMDFGGSTSLANLIHFMKSPNLIFHYSIEGSDLVVDWYDGSQSYSFNNFPLTNSFIGNLTENGIKSTTYVTQDFNNVEEGVRWYSFDFQNSTWSAPTVVNDYPNTFSLTIPLSSESKYKVSTFNTKGADSYIPFEHYYHNKISISEFSETQDIIYEMYFFNNLVHYKLRENALVKIEVYDIKGSRIYSSNNFEKKYSGENIFNFLKFFIPYSSVDFVRFVVVSENNIIQTKTLKIIE